MLFDGSYLTLSNAIGRRDLDQWLGCRTDCLLPTPALNQIDDVRD